MENEAVTFGPEAVNNHAYWVSPIRRQTPRFLHALRPDKQGINSCVYGTHCPPAKTYPNGLSAAASRRPGCRMNRNRS